MHKLFKKIISSIIILTFSVVQIIPLNPTKARAQSVLSLPEPGVMLNPSDFFIPTLLRGLRVYPDEPLRLDFIVDNGHSKLKDESLQSESRRLIKYFLAALAIPESDLWVNLSPKEENKIVPATFGITEMGRDLLAQDYLLKQLTSTLMYPETSLGKEFWDRVYTKVSQDFGTNAIPVDTFNKVWIVPDKALVYEKGRMVFVVESRLKVMLEQEYVTSQLCQDTKKICASSQEKDFSPKVTQLIREILIPEIEKEINEGKNFAPLRQIYQSLILATWYKKRLSDGILAQLYVNRYKTDGIEVENKSIKYEIYDQYMKAFKKGVFNYIREDVDPVTNNIIPRHYFSGGVDATNLALQLSFVSSERELSKFASSPVGDIEEHQVELDASNPIDQTLETPGYRSIDQMIQHIEQKEQIYAGLVSGMREMDIGFIEAQKALNQFDEAFKNIENEIIFARRGTGELVGLSVRVFDNYLQSIREIHKGNRAWLVAYLDLIWPEAERKSQRFKDFHGQAKRVWLKWNAGIEIETRKKKTSRLSLNQEFLDLKEAFDSVPTRPRWQALVDEIIKRGFIIHFSGEASNRFEHHFERQMNKTVLESVLKEDSSEEVETLIDIFLPNTVLDRSSKNWKQKLRTQVTDWIKGYVQPLTVEKESQWKKIVIDRLGGEELGGVFRKPLENIQRKSRLQGVVVLLSFLTVIVGFIANGGSRFESVERLSREKAALMANSDAQQDKVLKPKSSLDSNDEESFTFQVGGAPRLDRIENDQTTEELSPERQKARDIVIDEIQKLEGHLEDASSQQEVLKEEIEEISLDVKKSKVSVLERAKELNPLEVPKKEAPQEMSQLKEPQEWHTPKQKDFDQGAKIDDNNKQNFQLQSYKMRMDDGNSESYSKILARSKGGNRYLQDGQYSRVTLAGDLVPRESEFKSWTIESEGAQFREWIRMESFGSRASLVYVPPGYVINGVETGKNVESYDVSFDQINGLWHISFDKSPGSIKLSVRPGESGELSELEAMEFVDERGEVIPRSEAKLYLRSQLSPLIVSIIDEIQDFPKQKKIKVMEKVLRLFYYSTNRLLNSSTFDGQSQLKIATSYFVHECDIGSFLRIAMTHLLDIPEQIQTGYLDFNQTDVFSSGSGHTWVHTVDGIRDSNHMVEESSKFFRKEGVSDEDWERELVFLKQRAKQKMKELESILLRLKEQKIQKEIQKQKEVLKQYQSRKSSVTNHEEIIKAYENALEDNHQLLKGLHNASLDQNKLNQIFAQIEYKIVTVLHSRFNKNQLMINGHYLLELLSILEEKNRFIEGVTKKEIRKNDDYIQELKSKIFQNIEVIARANKWELNEPLSKPIVVRQGDQKVITNFIGETLKSAAVAFYTLKDQLTGQKVTDQFFIEDDPSLISYAKGVYVFWNISKSEYFLKGENVEKYDLQPSYKVNLEMELLEVEGSLEVLAFHIKSSNEIFVFGITDQRVQLKVEENLFKIVMIEGIPTLVIIDVIGDIYLKNTTSSNKIFEAKPDGLTTNNLFVIDKNNWIGFDLVVSPSGAPVQTPIGKGAAFDKYKGEIYDFVGKIQRSPDGKWYAQVKDSSGNYLIGNWVAGKELSQATSGIDNEIKTSLSDNRTSGSADLDIIHFSNGEFILKKLIPSQAVIKWKASSQQLRRHVLYAKSKFREREGCKGSLMVLVSR